MRRVLAAVSALAIAVGGAIAFAGPSTAQDPLLPDAGTITLQTSSSSSGNKIVYVAASGATTEQTITEGCPATVEPGVLAITGASTRGACFGNRGFGDGQGGWPFYLNPNVSGQSEALTLSLGGAAADLEFKSFSLDIEASTVRGSDISITASLDGVPVGDYEIDLNAEPPTGVFANYRVDRTLATPADTLVLKAKGSTKFQLEGDTRGIGSIFTLTDIATIPTGDDNTLVLEDESGVIATIINESGEFIPFVQLECTDTANPEPCVSFKLLTDQNKRLKVWVSVPLDLGTPNLQELWQTEIDFLEDRGFELGQIGTPDPLDPGCKINEASSEQQACVLEFLYPDIPGDDFGNPELRDDASEPISSRLWDLWVNDPKLR